MSQTLHKDDIKQLNSFLRGEISAVETYDQALEKAESPDALAILRENRESHSRRVTLLREEIARLGGEPESGSGAWGAFAKAVEGGAKLLGESAAVAALEEGEDHGLADYRRDLPELTPAARSFVNRELLPPQQQSHAILERLKKTL